MQDLKVLAFVLLSQCVQHVSSQFKDDVITQGTTCEEKYGYRDCLTSHHCMRKFVLECECIPRILTVFIQPPMDGALLCLYSQYMLELGEPKCCPYYYFFKGGDQSALLERSYKGLLDKTKRNFIDESTLFDDDYDDDDSGEMMTSKIFLSELQSMMEQYIKDKKKSPTSKLLQLL